MSAAAPLKTKCETVWQGSPFVGWSVNVSRSTLVSYSTLQCWHILVWTLNLSGRRWKCDHLPSIGSPANRRQRPDLSWPSLVPMALLWKIISLSAKKRKILPMPHLRSTICWKSQNHGGSWNWSHRKSSSKAMMTRGRPRYRTCDSCSSYLLRQLTFVPELTMDEAV